MKKAEEAQPNAVPAIRRTMGEGGPAGTMFVVRGFNSFEERAAWPAQGEVLRKVYGETEARLMNDVIQRSIASRESTVLVHRPDLSSQSSQ